MISNDMNISFISMFIKEPNIELSILKNIDLTKVTSWSQIEIQCAVNNIEVSMNMFKCILLCSFHLKNLFNVMMKCIENTNFLVQYAGNEEIAEVIYSSNPQFSEANVNIEIQRFLLKYINYSVGTASISLMLDYWDYDDNKYDEKASVKRMYKMMDVFDKRFPLMFIKFFNKHKKHLLEFDGEFINWLFMRTRIKAKSNELFKKIYNAMIIDKNSFDQKRMFMS